MPKDKAEIVNPRKTRTSNESTIKKTASRAKNEEVKKTRENSTDRKEVKKVIATSKTKISSRISDSTSTSSRTSNLSKSKLITNTSSTPTVSRSTKSVPLKSTQTFHSTSSRTSQNNSVVKGTKTSSRDVTSKRVTKEQFFPKKYPYSSYLHEKSTENEKKNIESPKPAINRTSSKPVLSKSKQIEQNKSPTPKLSRERTMTRILSPSEVKVIKNMVEIGDKNSEDRPRTATIKKHIEPEIQIVVNEPSNSQLNSLTAEVVSQLEENYEDDFESYESDFEACSSSSSTADSITTPSTTTNEDDSISTSDISDNEGITELAPKRTNSASTDDERKLDSGNYDLPDMKHKQILDNIKEAIERENSNLNIGKNMNKNVEIVNSLASLSDEGFEDGMKFVSNNGFVNFFDAKEKQQKKKITSKSKKRGEDLMNMIRLNSVSFSLFDMEAISYEEFMKSYGRTGTMQISSQTGDDDLDEENQTDLIEMKNQSTQFPIRFSAEEDDLWIGKHLNSNKDLEWQNNKHINSKNLTTFLKTQGEIVLNLLEQNEIKFQQRLKQNTSQIPFSEGYLSINYENVSFLNNRTVSSMTYSEQNQLLTIHKGNIQVFMNQEEQLLSRPTICIWDIFDLNYPQYILVSSGEITKACFDCYHGYLIFASISDGCICLWDLRENSKLHRNVYFEPTDNNHILRSATYTTSALIETEICKDKIVSIQSYQSSLFHENQAKFIENLSGLQICTLSESGFVVIWSVINKQATIELLSEDQGLIPWGSVMLSQGLVISLQKLNPSLSEIQCFDLHFHHGDTNHLFISSNYGVLHCLTTGMKPRPKVYTTEKSSKICVEMAPFSPIYFLSGCENSTLKIHSRFYEKAIISLRSLNDTNKIEPSIDAIEWSNIHPCVFFIKNSGNNILVWDLQQNDMYPLYTIPFQETITDIKLSPVIKQGTDATSYLAIASEELGIRLHKLSKEFSYITPEQYKTELNSFLNYASRL